MTELEREIWREFFNETLDDGYYTPIRLLVDNRSGQRYSMSPILAEPRRSMRYTPYDLNVKLMEIFGLDPRKVISYRIVGDGDGLTLDVEWLPDLDDLDNPADLDDLEPFREKFKLVPIDDEEPPRE